MTARERHRRAARTYAATGNKVKSAAAGGIKHPKQNGARFFRTQAMQEANAEVLPAIHEAGKLTDQRVGKRWGDLLDATKPTKEGIAADNAARAWAVETYLKTLNLLKPETTVQEALAYVMERLGLVLKSVGFCPKCEAALREKLGAIAAGTSSTAS